jgi:hypothetical protein
MSHLMKLATFLVWLVGLCGSAAAAEARSCVTVSVNSDSSVAVVRCPSAGTPETWQAAGISACNGKRRCNAWIWDDAAKMPKMAPATDGGLLKTESRSARAIWINDAQQLVVVKQQR